MIDATLHLLSRAMSSPCADWFHSQPDEAKHGKFLKDLHEMIIRDAIFEGTKRGNPIIRWRDPKHLEEILDLLPSDLPADHTQLLKLLSEVIKYSVKTGHPYFVNQLYCGIDPYGLAGHWVCASLNPSVYTYEVSPVFSLMEETILKEMRKLVGYSNGAGDGIFCPGGSMANGYAINVARYWFDSNIKKSGLHGMSRLVLFASEDAHYSVQKMAAFLGLGIDSVINVQVDDTGSMDVKHLEELILSGTANGAVPFMVFATAGTTVLGAIDPLPSIANICMKYKLWLHVDAAWGGGLLFSKKHKYLLSGIERADSVAWNPHKLLTCPQQCSVLVVKHEGLLKPCHSQEASYLFQKDKFYDTDFDVGDKYIQCGRRADVVPFWVMWKAKGSSGFEKHVDTIMEVSQYFKNSIKSRPAFKLVIEPQYINVCFWFIPPRLSKKETEPNYTKQLHQVAPKLRELMMRKGTIMINYQPLRNWPNFFRFVTQNSHFSCADVDFLLDEMEKLGAEL